MTINNGTRLNKQGFTLIEAVIVFAVIAISFTAIYSLLAKTMLYNAESRYETIAAGLVQEGIEMIKNKKEENEMKWAIWNTQSNEPQFDEEISLLSDCNPLLSINNYSFSCDSNNLEMRYSKTEEKYTTSGDSGLTFTRKCRTQSAGEGMLWIRCEVEWTSALLDGQNRKIIAETVVTDWER